MNISTTRGFTLLELMISLVIMLLSITIGIPTLQQTLIEHRVNNQIIALNQAIVLARTYAINKENRVILCPLDDSGECQSNWQLGYSLFVDTNNDKHFQASADRMILEQNHISRFDQLLYSGGKMLRFNERGHISGRSGTFRYCPAHVDTLNYSRAIIVSLSGRPRQSKDIDNDGKDEINGKNDHVICTQ